MSHRVDSFFPIAGTVGRRQTAARCGNPLSRFQQTKFLTLRSPPKGGATLGPVPSSDIGPTIHTVQKIARTASFASGEPDREVPNALPVLYAQLGPPPGGFCTLHVGLESFATSVGTSRRGFRCRADGLSCQTCSACVLAVAFSGSASWRTMGKPLRWVSGLPSGLAKWFARCLNHVRRH